MGRREPTPVVPPTKAQVVERKTLQLGEFRFETCGGRRTLGADGPRARLRKTAPHSLCRTGAQCLAHGGVLTVPQHSGYRR
jgi:hypothetical protein